MRFATEARHLGRLGQLNKRCRCFATEARHLGRLGQLHQYYRWYGRPAPGRPRIVSEAVLAPHKQTAAELKGQGDTHLGDYVVDEAVLAPHKQTVGDFKGQADSVSTY